MRVSTPLLWKGIADYARERGGRYLCGCSSLTSQDATVGASAYTELYRRHLAPIHFRTQPTSKFECPLAQLHPEPIMIPKLLRAYLLGTNRDEQLSRVAAFPPKVHDLGTIKALFPYEPEGGTWIGVNEVGASFALVNWYAVTRQLEGAVVSRGRIPVATLALSEPSQVETALRGLPLARSGASYSMRAWRSLATSPVHPVWCEAPTPWPLSP